MQIFNNFMIQRMVAKLQEGRKKLQTFILMLLQMINSNNSRQKYFHEATVSVLNLVKGLAG